MPLSPLNRSILARRPRVALIAVAAVALVAAGGVGAGVALAAGGSSAPSTAPLPSTSAPTVRAVDTAGFPQGEGGIFTDTCTRTKTAADDPILLPGKAGQSMQHEFFGNRSTTAASVPSQLVGGTTSCTTSADASAYWVPVLFQKDVALHPAKTLIYWRAPSTTAASVHTIPQGLSIVAGDEGAMTPQGVQKVKWLCSGVEGRGTASPHDCAAGQQIRLVITFPSCWDGRTLNGATQQNVVYPAKPNAPCPTSHPVQIPQIVFHANYPTASAADLTLSMGPDTAGPVSTAHADFMNGWNADVLASDVHACTTANVRCGPVTGAGATPKGGTTDAQRHAMRMGQAKRHHRAAA